LLKRIYVDNYKCLVNFELRPNELTLLLGPNGSGKSAVLDVLYALREVLSGTVKINDQVAFPAGTLTRWQTSPRQVFELDVESKATGQLTYRLEVEHQRETGRARVELERLSAPSGTLFEFAHGTVQLYRDDHSKGPSFTGDWSESWLARFLEHRDNPRPAHFLDFMRRMVICRIHPQGIAAESRGEDVVLARDGSNFAAWYRAMVQERPDLMPEFLEALRQAIDGLAGLRLEKVGQDARALMIAFEHHGASYSLGLDELSDGQRALVLLYSLLYFSAGQGYTLLLDEPDNYLALAEIQPWLMALSDACGGAVSQAVLCSHHPELIDYLGPDHGLLLDRYSSGPAIVRSVADRELVGGLKLSEIIARGWEL
jgi:predicted ATPase